MALISENREAGSNSSIPSTAEKDVPSTIRVLLVDDDSICLKDLEAILQRNKYEVVAVQDGAEALSTLRKRKRVFDLVITDVHMPGMNGFELLDQIGKEFKIPVIMMAENDEKNVVTRGLEGGACFVMLKPVTETNVQNIWQHVYIRKRDELLEVEETSSVQESSLSTHSKIGSKTRSRTPSRNQGIVIEETDPHSATSSVKEVSDFREQNKRKEREYDDDDERGDDDVQDGNRRRGHPKKKTRVIWNTDLHDQFLDAIDRLGLEKAVPKKILELMNVSGLTRENVASHLQKYRMYVKKLIKSKKAKEPSTAMNIANGALKSSFATGHSASVLLSNIQQRNAGATRGGQRLTDSTIPTSIAQRSSLASSYQPDNCGLLGRNSNSDLCGTTSNNLRNLYGNVAASTPRWFNRTVGPGVCLSSTAAAPQRQYGQPSVTFNNNNNNTRGPTSGFDSSSTQPSWLGNASTPTSWLRSPSTLPSLYNQHNAISTSRYPSMASSGIGMEQQSHFRLGTNGTYYGGGGTRPVMGITQQNQLNRSQPATFGTGPLAHNLNIWNRRQGQQLNNTIGAGNFGGSGSSSFYGNANLSRTPLFNSPTNINLNPAGGIQIGNNNIGSDMESGRNIGGMFFPELLANRSNNVNVNYSNQLMTNKNLISRTAEKMPLHQAGQAQGSLSSTTDQTFRLGMNSGNTIQDSAEATTSLNHGANNNQLSTSMFITNNGITSEQDYSPLVSSASMFITNNGVTSDQGYSPPASSESMFITNNGITSEQDYSPPVSAPKTEEAEHEEGFSEILNLLRSDELNSLPPLFDEGDLFFKQFDEHTAGYQQSYGEEIFDPYIYQMDEEI